MKYVEVVLLILMVTITLSALTTLELMPSGSARENLGTPIYDQNIFGVTQSKKPILGTFCPDLNKDYSQDNMCKDSTDESIACRMSIFKTKRAAGSGLTVNTQILEPGLISSIVNFIEIFSSGITGSSRLFECMIPYQSPIRNYTFLFTIPLLFMFLVAVFQVVSGRDLEGGK